jgi:hypothetical protein
MTWSLLRARLAGCAGPGFPVNEFFQGPGLLVGTAEYTSVTLLILKEMYAQFTLYAVESVVQIRDDDNEIISLYLFHSMDPSICKKWMFSSSSLWGFTF